MKFLTNDSIAKIAPSVFAEAPASSVSSKYTFVPTTQVLDTMASAGWLPVRAQENRVRLEGKRGFQRHILRLRHRDAQDMKVGDSLPEIVLTNSHDGLAAFELSLGLFRLVCSNGLVVANGMFESARIKHIGYRDEEVIDVVARIMSATPQLTENVQTLQSTVLESHEQLALAQGALSLRWEDGEAPVQAKDLLRKSRWEDNAPTIWNTYNTVQENVLRGGLRGYNAAGRRTSTRAVASITEDVRLNKALWSMAQALANHKKSA